jgi:hypothetical protein
MAVTERIRDIGQNVVQSYFQTGSSSSSSYFHIFFLIAFLKKFFISSKIIIMRINYIIVICVNMNNAVINNNYRKYKTLFWSSIFPWARERISSKFLDNLVTRPPKGSPNLM